MRIHLIGIGGIGVSALARYFLSQGWQVSGSNLANAPENAPLLQELSREGIKIKIGYNKKNIPPGTDLVIHTQAETSKNPEVAEAKRRKIKTLSYPKALGELTKVFTTIALAGTHGKSTTTALTSLVLMEAKLDPTVVIGTKLRELRNRNFRAGKSKYLVVEADEYKDAFLNYHPQAALVTNIDREHLDYFKNLDQTKRSFGKFIKNLDKNGILILNKDSAPLFSLGSRLKRKIIWYSLKEKVLAKKIKKHLKISGDHNLSNALAVFKLTKNLGVKEKDILKAFSKYEGAYRRMEYKGKFHGSPVYDDYGHHPTEIKATLAAFRERFPKAQIICVFQPHQAERLKKLFKEFTAAFDEADALILLDIFKVRGRETSDKRQETSDKDSKQLAEAIHKRQEAPETIYLPRPEKLKQTLNKLVEDKSVIVMMGAGNITELTPRLVDGSK